MIWFLVCSRITSSYVWFVNAWRAGHSSGESWCAWSDLLSEHIILGSWADDTGRDVTKGKIEINHHNLSQKDEESRRYYYGNQGAPPPRSIHALVLFKSRNADFSRSLTGVFMKSSSVGRLMQDGRCWWVDGLCAVSSVGLSWDKQNICSERWL